MIEAPARTRWRAVLSALATDTVAILPGFLAAGLAVQIRDDIGLTLSGLGISIGVFFGSAALASAPFGALVERWGWTAGLRVAVLLAAASLAGVGWMARSHASLTALFVVGGLAVAMGHPAANLAVARCVPPSRHGLFFGIKHAAVPTSTLLAGLAVPAVALTVGWRWAFFGGALLAVATAIAIPRSAGPPPGTSPAPDRGSSRPSTDLRLLVILAVAVGLGIGAFDALASFIVSYAVEMGIPEGTAGLVLAAGSIVGITSRLVAGWIIDRIQSAGLTAVGSMLLVGGLGIVVLNLGATVGLFVGGLIAFAGGWGWSGLFTFAVVKENPNAPAAATGITQVGKLVGAALGPAGFGLLADHVSFSVAWWATTAAVAVAATLMFFVRSRAVDRARPPELLRET